MPGNEPPPAHLLRQDPRPPPAPLAPQDVIAAVPVAPAPPVQRVPQAANAAVSVAPPSVPAAPCAVPAAPSADAAVHMESETRPRTRPRDDDEPADARPAKQARIQAADSMSLNVSDGGGQPGPGSLAVSQPGLQPRPSPASSEANGGEALSSPIWDSASDTSARSSAPLQAVMAQLNELLAQLQASIPEGSTSASASTQRPV